MLRSSAACQPKRSAPRKNGAAFLLCARKLKPAAIEKVLHLGRNRHLADAGHSRTD